MSASLSHESSPEASWRIAVSDANFEDGVRCVVMPCCGFTFDAAHTDTSDGFYTCPTCSPSPVQPAGPDTYPCTIKGESCEDTARCWSTGICKRLGGAGPDTVERVFTALQEFVHGCREEGGAGSKCWKPAEYLLWGKLLPPEALGPRCYDHAAEHVGHRALCPRSGYALVNLRELAHLVVAAVGPVGRPEKRGKHEWNDNGFCKHCGNGKALALTTPCPAPVGRSCEVTDEMVEAGRRALILSAAGFPGDWYPLVVRAVLEAALAAERQAP